MTLATEAEDIKGIWDYTEEELRPPLLSPKEGSANYHLKVREAEVGAWDDGRPRLDLRTEVACGEHAGQFGPRVTLSYGGFTTKAGRVWSTEQAFKAFFVTAVKALHPQPIAGVEPPIDADKLAIIGQALVGLEFVGGIVRQGDYDNIGKIYPMTKVPEGFSCEHTLAQFKL